MAAATVAALALAADAWALRMRTRSLAAPPGMRLRCTIWNVGGRPLEIVPSIRTARGRITTDFIAVEWADELAHVPAYVIAESGDPEARYCAAAADDALPRDLAIRFEAFDPVAEAAF